MRTLQTVNNLRLGPVVEVAGGAASHDAPSPALPSEKLVAGQNSVGSILAAINSRARSSNTHQADAQER